MGVSLDRLTAYHNGSHGIGLVGASTTIANVSVSDAQIALNGVDGIHVHSTSVARTSVDAIRDQ